MTAEQWTPRNETEGEGERDQDGKTRRCDWQRRLAARRRGGGGTGRRPGTR